jgi:hypothetical protein
MATTYNGTTRVFGGTRYRRFSDPLPSGGPSSYGLYPWSTFKARLGSTATGEFVSADNTAIADATLVNVLIFSSDIPAVATARVTDTTAITQYFNDVENRVSVPFLVTVAGGATPAAADFLGKVVTGYAGVSGAATSVPCSGFPAQFLPTPSGSAGDADLTDLIVYANSPTICAPVSQNVVGSGSLLQPIPVILLNSDYTNAIRFSGSTAATAQYGDNVILTAAGKLWQVVGLWKAA